MERLKGTVNGLLLVLIPLFLMKRIGFPPLVMGIIFLVIAAISFMVGRDSFKGNDEGRKAFYLTLLPLALLLSIVAFIMAFSE